ncbi:TadE/TadG family type IV pilus assembly protein [Roseibium alexandrii]|uniref:Flp pilus assembly protein TadG n=1 Tax=Roseibium alexandrii (strain DSM 17067 / NCIMB 14079 / DFL-11) TaxID=244592 RepID=A0A5E8H4V1_ROSAD|nr:TadE/TadG family type IV pilus assembly protein [Roseibium alexandrii]EEE47606.2 Flp pilus assembly protein TadG [Roseibium alexandrii DFL-11]
MRSLFPILASRFSSLGADRSGNVAILTALAFVPLMLITIGSLDVVRMTTAQAKLQSTLDSATLAAASLSNTADIEDTVDEYIQANLPDTAPWTTLKLTMGDVTDSLNAKSVEITATVDIEMTILKLAGIDKTSVLASSVAQQAAQNIEVSVVLDISSSMGGSKITSLREAAKGFIDTMLKEDEDKEYTSLSIIPFGGTVNIGDFYDTYAVNSSTPGVIDSPSSANYYVNKNVPYGKFMFSTEREGCIEYTDDDFDMAAIPANSRPQVPDFTKWVATNPWCPSEDSAMVLNSNNTTDLKALIDDMDLSDGTGMDIGALWGAKVLSGSMRGQLGGDFSDRPADFNDEDTLKVAVIMTDGAITAQFRPRDYTTTGKIKNKTQQTIVSKGNINTASTKADDAVAYFKRVCEYLNDNNVQVYTIGFQINSGSLPDQLLKYCASSLSNYYFVEGLNIEDAFNAIASAVNNLRVSG